MAQWRSVVPAPVHFFLARPVVPPLLPKTEKAAKFEVPMPPSLGAYPESAGIDGSAFTANFDRQKGRFGFPSLKLQSPAEAIQKARRRGEKNGYKWGLREAYHNVEINPWPDYESGSISSQSSMSKAETMAGLDAPQGTTTHSSGSRERVLTGEALASADETVAPPSQPTAAPPAALSERQIVLSASASHEVPSSAPAGTINVFGFDLPANTAQPAAISLSPAQDHDQGDSP
jgi:hypothetical protein